MADSVFGGCRSYDEGSCGSGVVFFEERHDELHQDDVVEKPPEKKKPSEIITFPQNAAGIDGWPCSALFSDPPGNDGPVDDGHRCISSGWSINSEGDFSGTSACRSDPQSKDGAETCLPEDTATLYIQVELCKAETLQGWIANRNSECCNGTTDVSIDFIRDALKIFIQCTSALAHMHGKLCMHRDVKPSNILFAQDDTVRLADFGLAKVIEGEHDHLEDCPSPTPSICDFKRRRSNRVGTPSYASPEQRNGCPLSLATDVYSLGLVLVELICPVQTQMERVAVLEGLRVHRQVPPAAVAKCPRLARLAVRMTQPDPSERPTTQEILQEVRQMRRFLHRRRAASAAAHLTPNAKVDTPPPRVESKRAAMQRAIAQRASAPHRTSVLQPRTRQAPRGGGGGGVTVPRKGNQQGQWLRRSCLRRHTCPTREVCTTTNA